MKGALVGVTALAGVQEVAARWLATNGGLSEEDLWTNRFVDAARAK